MFDEKASKQPNRSHLQLSPPVALPLFDPNPKERRIMPVLTRASNELFTRKTDECFPNLSDLFRHCQQQKDDAVEKWCPPSEVRPILFDQIPSLELGQEGNHQLNSWSFGQICSIAGVSRETVNKVNPSTAVDILLDTLPAGTKPLQFLTEGDRLRSIHGTAYTRLFNADLLGLVNEFAVDFQPPQQASTGASGLYCGEQDMFIFLIDPLGWTEIDGEAFAPGFFLWNSEVGKRTVGIQTFWFQAVCQNHVVWDAIEVTEFTRKHTAKVHDSLDFIRQHVEQIATKRDERRDGFVNAIQKAMKAKLGADEEEVLKVLLKNGLPKNVAAEAMKIAREKGKFTIFSIVDALTRMAGKLPNAGERTELDMKAASLLDLAL
jgi:hypothetical protein